MPELIQLQQALFGYRDGHNLLATSALLSPRVRQFLATVTDSSGPESNKNFDGAFTGLPIPDTDFYALFRTWTAPEMPRPGCVWSHVILIQLADLARIPALFLLGRLCSRPSMQMDVTRYENALTFDVTTTEENSIDKSDHQRLNCLIRALYGHPEGDIVILDDDNAPWEAAVFQVWTQQWPRLRREFAFSTGSFGNRCQGGIQFDLQVAPVSSERLWRRAGEKNLLLNFAVTSSDPLNGPTPEWIEIAESDLVTDRNRDFRRFLFDYGSDVEKPRFAFEKLASVFNSISARPEPEWKTVLCSVGELFPTPTEAVRLKKYLVSLPPHLHPSAKLERAWSIVSFLLDAKESAAYPNCGFDFADSAQSLWEEKREPTISLLSRLVQRDENPSAIAFARVIASAIDSTSLKTIAEGHGELVPLVIRHNSALAFEVDTWKLSDQTQTQIYETLTKLELGEPAWGKIVGAMFIASNRVAVREAATRAGQCAMTGAFRWLEHQEENNVLPSPVWRDALATPAEALLSQSTELQPAQLALCAWCVPPNHVRRTLSVNRNDVQRAANASSDVIPTRLRVPTAFLLLALGLGENSDAGENLVIRNFFVVHGALASSAYSSESWWTLAPELPTLRWWRDWDHCEKLRRAVHVYLSRRGGKKRLREFAKTPYEKQLARKVAETKIED